MYEDGSSGTIHSSPRLETNVHQQQGWGGTPRQVMLHSKEDEWTQLQQAARVSPQTWF